MTESKKKGIGKGTKRKKLTLAKQTIADLEAPAKSAGAVRAGALYTGGCTSQCGTRKGQQGCS